MSALSEKQRRPKFARAQPFRQVLQQRVDDYFVTAKISSTGGAAMIGKTIVMLTWLVGSYVALVWFAAAWWHAALAACSLAFAIAGTGMAIHHDANHGAYSSRPWLNNLCKRTLDVLGVSSYNWGYTHNLFHHTYTNIDGLDQDVDLGPLARLAPAQRRRGFHAYQHWYMWLLYSFTMFYFVLAEDIIQWQRARSGPHGFPAPRGRELVGLIASKLFVLGWAVVVPLVYHPWWLVLIVLVATFMVSGFLLGLTFQVAHLVPDSTFPRTAESSPDVDREWAVHQCENTADFAHSSKLVTWFVGGLNYQIEHHLFPKVCHLHYPRIAPIVERTCREFDVPYTHYASVAEALRAHGRWLAAMGTSSS